jgi:hypothetical protein
LIDTSTCTTIAMPRPSRRQQNTSECSSSNGGKAEVSNARRRTI